MSSNFETGTVFTELDSTPEVSLRDRIAIAALQGLVADDASVLYNKGKHCKEAAESCYRMADAMIKSREQTSD